MNYDLSKFYPSLALRVAWKFGPQIGVDYSKPDSPVLLTPTRMREVLLAGYPPDVPSKDYDILAATLDIWGLYGLMKQGPVIIHPSLQLCRAMADTNVNFFLSEFKMPFSHMAIELPQEITGKHFPSITIIYKPFTPHSNRVYIFTYSPFNGITYHVMFNEEDSFERTILLKEQCDDEDEFRLQAIGSRVVLNLCMLASIRKIHIGEYSPKVQRHRRARDERLNELAARNVRELSFRDLVLYDRPYEKKEFGREERQGKQHRRGHWRNVAHGPRFSLHTRKWINEYWTHKDENISPESIILQ